MPIQYISVHYMSQSQTTIPCKPGTLEQVRELKRGGESYDALLQQMANQYSPEQSDD